MQVSNDNKQKIRKVGVALQGGGSLGAFSAGVLHSLLNDPTIEIKVVTGTSAGAMNGAIIAQTLNKFGHTDEGRAETQKRLLSFWRGITTSFNTSSSFIRNLIYMHPAAPFMATQQLMTHIRRMVKNPRALKSARHTRLYVNAVDTNGQERIFTGNDMTHNAIQASAALRPYFNKVSIDGKEYMDGAYLGGSNPPITPLESHLNSLDAVIFIMTNPPHHPITPRSQSELCRDDVRDTDGLILYQSYDHIAKMMYDQAARTDRQMPIHVIFPDVKRAYTMEEKQNTEYGFVSGLFRKGQTQGQAFLNIFGDSLHVSSSMGTKHLERNALRSCTLPAKKNVMGS